MPRRSEAEVRQLKPKVMKELVKSNYNTGYVCKKFGIDHKTLTAWRNEYEASADLSHEVAVIRQETAINYEQMRAKVARDNLDKLNGLMQQLVERASVLAKTEPDLTRISIAMRAATEALKVLTAVDKEGKDDTNSTQQTINMFQQTIYQLNNNERIKGELIDKNGELIKSVE